MHYRMVAIYKLCTTCEGNTGFREPEGLRVCSVPSVARALRGWPEGFMKSRIPRVYGVHNMFSAEPENSGYGSCRFQAQD